MWQFCHIANTKEFCVTDCRQDWLKDPADYAAPVEELALWLARLIRFQSRSPVPMSVARHSVIVMLLLPETRTRAAAQLALLHDAHEVYVSDVPRPVKHRLGFELDNITNEIDSILFPRYRLVFTEQDRKLVDEADNLANHIEAETLHLQSIDKCAFALRQFAHHCPALRVDSRVGSVAKKLAWKSTVDSDKNGWLWWWEELKFERTTKEAT